MTWAFVHEDPEILAKDRARAAVERNNVDWSGIGLLSTCLVTTEYIVEEGQRREWFDDRLIRVLTFIALATLAAFVARQLTARAPVMNLRLLKDSRFAAGKLLNLCLMAALMAIMFLLSVFLQQGRGLTAMQAGLAQIPMTLAMMVVMPIAGSVYERVPPRVMMACGLVLMGAGGYQLSGVNLAIGEWGLAVPLAVLGAGMALAFVPMETLAFSRIPRHLLADAAGLSNVLQETGGAVGLALFTSLFLRESVSARAGVAAHLGITNPMAVQQLSSLQAHLPGGPSMASRAMALRFLGGSVARQAMELAYQHFFLLVGLLILSPCRCCFSSRWTAVPARTASSKRSDHGIEDDEHSVSAR